MRKLEIVSPCPKDFASMPERGRERYCDACDKNVVDLSKHTEEEVDVIAKRGACVRILRDRRTGQVLLAAAAVAIAACSSAVLDAPTPTHTSVQPQTQPAPDAGEPQVIEMVGELVMDPEPEPEKR